MGNKKIRKLIKQDIETSILRKSFALLGMIFPFVGVAKTTDQLKHDASVMFLPDIAYQNAQGQVVCNIQAWVYEKERRRGLTHMLALFLGIHIATLPSHKRQRLYERTQLFRVDSEYGKQLVIKDQDGHLHKMPKTTRNGRSHILVPVTIGDNQTKQNIAFHLTNFDQFNKKIDAVSIYVPPHGLSVISDIDDTIKHSYVKDKKQLLINTFMDDFIAIEGMADLYQSLNKSNNVAYHYVSSSPIQLYPVLFDFMNKNGYPMGSVHLREATRWSDLIPGPNTSKAHKTKNIERILCAYPERQFILIGDSSENDPALYAHFKLKYKQQIKAIIIRNVTLDKDTSYYQTTFKDIDASQWLVASSVDEMQNFINRLAL